MNKPKLSNKQYKYIKKSYKNIENEIECFDDKWKFTNAQKPWSIFNSAPKGLIHRNTSFTCRHVMSYIVQVTLYHFLFFGVTGRGQCYLAVRLNTVPPRWEEPPAVCCRLSGYLPSSLEVRLRLRIHHRGPPPVTHDVSRLTRRPRPAAPSYAYRNSSTTVTHPSSLILFFYIYTGLITSVAHLHEEKLLRRRFLYCERIATHVSLQVTSSHRSGNLPDNGRFDFKW